MIVDWAIYRDGRRVEAPGDLRAALGKAQASAHGFLWIGLHEPTEDEFDLVSSELGLHQLAVEDAVKAHQRPKLERYEDALFVVLKPLRYLEDTSSVETGELMLFLGDGFVVTVRHGEAHPLAGVRKRLESEPDLLSYGPSAVLYAVCDAVVDGYTEISHEVERDVDEVETRVFSPSRSSDAERIYLLKREVLEFRRAAAPLAAPMVRLAEGSVLHIHPDTRPFFRDVADHVARVTESVEAADRLLTDILHAHLAQVGVRQNDDMRRISAWVAIIAVPTMVAGIYGMNFDHMPELRWTWGYPGVMLFIGVACTVLYRLFKRAGWL